MSYIPYELCKNLDLFIGVRKEDVETIKEDGFLEDVKMKFRSINGWMNKVKFKYTINGNKYTHSCNYNTTSPYALYICQLFEE